ncbi:calcium-binding protein [Sulfuritalea sp.]|uniref:calcium-binding protein n=1 Tax=Sulfuritalea sp. TaxID=2480090 RepID=UPI00286E1445|nr:calcium-binding protein [Sulfuritalea sp.]
MKMNVMLTPIAPIAPLGGTGNDTLRGGLGTDTYRIDKNGGLDTILDAGGADGSDGQGSIIYNGSTLSGTLTQDKVTRNLYRHPDNPTLEFRYIGAEGARGSLVIIDPAGARIILQDWASGELGLALAGSPATTPSRSSIDGDLNLTEYTATVAAVGGVITYDPTWRNIQVLDTTFQYDADGNIAGIASRDVKYNQVDALGNLTGTLGGPSRDDSLNGSGNGDQIRGYAGNDTLRGNGGDDSIEGGTDDDRVLAGAGDDRILGGSGSDILQGEADDDTLYAEDAVALDQLYAQGETQSATGLRGDWLDGGAGDDTLAGEGGNDMLLGGTLLVWMLKSRRWRDGAETRSASNDPQWRVAA